MAETATTTAAAKDHRTGSHLIAAALEQELARDETVIAFGEDVGKLGGVFGATRRLARRFGSERVFDTPVSETAFMGMAVGVAQCGFRPVVELMFVDFLGVCFDQIANQLAKNHYMSGGRVRLPVVVRTAVGCIGSAAQHSQVLGATFAHIPGLKVVFPASPADLQRLLVAAVRDDDPVVYLEHKELLTTRLPDLALNDVQESGTPIEPVELGRLRRVRHGDDLTIVTAGYMTQESLRAAAVLAEEGWSVGVVDLRTLVPLDRDGLVRESVAAPRMLVVDEDYLPYGMTGEILATVVEQLGSEAPRMARHALEVPVPASKVLEEQVVPSSRSIADRARALLEG